MTGVMLPVRLVTADRANPASSYLIYTEKARAALVAAGRSDVEVLRLPMSAESRRGGILRPTVYHFLRSFPRDAAIYHATEPNTALRHVDVVTFHDLFAFQSRGISFRVFRAVVRSAASRARRIVTQTPAVVDEIRRYLGEEAAAKARVVPPAFPIPPPGRASRARDVLWVGSLDVRKRPADFLRTLARIPGSRLRVTFLCHSGGSAIEADVRSAFDAARAVHDVEWISENLSLEGLDRLYRSSAVLVSTSRVEGFHYPVMEAWSRGTRVVVPRSPPYPDTYGSAAGVEYFDPETGFVGELRSALEKGPFSPDADRLASFSFAAVGRRLAAVYDELPT